MLVGGVRENHPCHLGTTKGHDDARGANTAALDKGGAEGNGHSSTWKHVEMPRDTVSTGGLASTATAAITETGPSLNRTEPEWWY